MRELSLNVMDVVQNSISAGASLIEINVSEDKQKDLMVISISDNGRGMTPDEVEKVTDPFFTTRTTRTVGLGVPLFKMEAEMTGGSFNISSQKGIGTKLEAFFKPSSVDMIPLGDINDVVHLLVTCNIEIDFIFTHKIMENGNEEKEFVLDTKEIKEILGDVPLNSPEIVIWLKDYINEQTEAFRS